MPEEYGPNLITTLAKRLRPFLLSTAAEVSGGGGNAPLYVQCYRALRYPSTQVEPLASSGAHFGPEMANGYEVYAGGWFMTPPGYTGTITYTPVILSTSTTSGNWYLRSAHQIWTVGGASAFSAGSLTVIASTGSATLHILTSIARTISITEQSRIALDLLRDSTDALDTYEDSIRADGWIIAYG